jgi:murein L,D-transpeptidase YcbB/YkuD
MAVFPNEYAIYLHDTPQEELFEESERDFSNGCIRVEDPQALGVFVLGPQGWDAEKISEHMDGDSTERVEVEETINIYIVYFTAFPTWGEEEPVKFYPDIYKLDEDRL